MAKKLQGNFNFLGLDPSQSALDSNVIKSAVDNVLGQDPNIFKSYHSEEFLRPQVEYARYKNEIDRQRNLSVNSLNFLAKEAGYDDAHASNLYNRITSISDLDFDKGSEELKNLTKELDDLQEQATTNQHSGVDYWADFAGTVESLSRGTAKLFQSDDTNKKYDLEKYLGSNKPDYASLKEYSTPEDVTKYVSKLVNQQRQLLESRKVVSDLGIDKMVNLLEQSSKVSNKPNALDDIMMPLLETKFKTPGSDFFRDPNSDLALTTFDKWASYWNPEMVGSNMQKNAEYVKDFQDKMRRTVKSDPTKSVFDESAFLKHDLASEALGTYKLAIQNELNKTLEAARLQEEKAPTGVSPKNNPLYKSKIEKLNNALNIAVQHEKEIDSIYGVQKGDRSGALNALYHSGKEAMVAGTNFLFNLALLGNLPKTGTYDANTTLALNAGYKPEVIDYDKYGNPVLSSQVFYETKAGSKKNWGGFFESGLQIVGDMIPTILLTRGVGGAVRSAASAEAAALSEGASTAGLATKTLNVYDKINKVAVLPKKVPLVGGPLRIADRVATTASVYTTVYPRVYQEELKWGGNASERARLMAFNEALTEGLGFPEVGGLKVTGYRRGLGAAARTATDVPLTRTQRFTNFANGAGYFTKTALKVNLLETMEEEMALFGEYMISKGYEEEYDRVGRQKTELNDSTIIDTFVESFKGGLLYSGLNTGMRHYQITRPDALRDYARYEAAQNPELFKAKLVADFRKNPGSMTQKDLQNGIIEIDNLASTFKSLSSLDNLKDLNTFLDDEDARFNLFTRADQRNTLSMIDFESLTDEQREELTSYKLMSEISDKGLKRADELKLRVAELAERAREETLTPEEQAEYMKSQQDYFALKQLSRYKYFNRRDLSTEQVKFLTENGIMTDNSFNFTQEDLNKMISDVDTDILKTEKRAFQYASMTESQKKQRINQAYDDRISLISQMQSPAELNNSYSAIKRDYEYLDQNVANVSQEMMDNKKRLMEAYGARFDELTATQENGRNAFENSIAEVSLEELINSNDLTGLHDLVRALSKNQDHVDSGFFNIMQESIGIAHATIIDNLSKLSPEAKMNALLPIFDKLVKENVKSFYEPDALRETFTHDEGLKLDISNEEFEALRNNLMELRGKRRSDSLAATGRLDNVDTPVVDPANPPSDELSELANAASVASTEVDEAGDSEKKLKENDYYNRITANKTPQQIVEVIKNRINSRFNAQSKRAKSLIKIIDNYLADKDRVKFDTEWKAVVEDIQNEIDNLLTSNAKSKRAETLTETLNEAALWNRSMKKMLLQNPTTTFTPSPTVVEEAPEGLNPNAPIEDAPVVLLESQEKELEQLDSVQQARRSRLMQLTSSLKTAAIEYDGKNVRNSDVAVARRVAQLDSLSEDGEIQTKIVNRRQYLRETLGKLYPNKSNQEIEEDLQAINQFFTQTDMTVDVWDSLNDSQKDEFLQPINDLLGKHFFSNNEFSYFIKNKGKGLITQPSVIVTVADEKGKVALIDGYPLELQFTISEKNANKAWPNIPWRNSQRVVKDAQDFSIKEGDVMNAHKKGYEAREALVKYLSENDDADVIVPAELTAGVLIGPEAFQFIGETTVGQSVKLEDFQLAENAATAIFGKRFKFDLGRLYYNNNGNPLIIMNTQISKEDADVLADLVFSNDASVVNPVVLKEYLMSIMNQIDPQSRILLFDGDTYAFTNAEGQMVYQLDQLLKPTLTTGKKGSYKHRTLGKEEFSQLLQKMYYKVDKKYLQDGEREGDRLPRFKRVQDAEGNMTITMSNESYLDYLKRTHQFPVDKEDNLLTLGNKNLYLDSAAVEQKATTKKTSAPAPAKKTPTSTRSGKADIERRRQEELKPYDERDTKSLEAIMPNNPNHPTFKVGMKFSLGMNILVEDTLFADNYDGREDSYEAITVIMSPAEFGEDGKMTKAAKVKVTVFNTKEDADKAIQEKYETVKSKVGQKQQAINAKYDAELAALETPTRPTLTPKVNDELQIIPTDQVESALGLTQPINADKYNAAVAAMRINPANIVNIEVITKDPQTGQLATSDYEVGSVFANTFFYRITVKVGNTNAAVFAFKGGLRDNPMSIQVTGTGSNTKFNVVSNETTAPEVEENVPRGKMSLEDLSAAVEETPQTPANSVVYDSMDNSQQEEGKKNQEDCKPSAGNRFKTFGKNKPNRFNF